jgi:hypothetical protein
MAVLAYFCECIGPHRDDCALYQRLLVKERVCTRLHIANYIEPRIAAMIDRLVARRLCRLKAVT